MEAENGFEGWAIVELMGHRRLGAWVSEADLAPQHRRARMEDE